MRSQRVSFVEGEQSQIGIALNTFHTCWYSSFASVFLADSFIICLQIKYSEVTYDTTFENYTMLTGNIVSLGMGGIICVVASLIFPEDYDFVSMKQIRMLDDDVAGDKGFAAVGRP